MMANGLCFVIEWAAPKKYCAGRTGESEDTSWPPETLRWCYCSHSKWDIKIKLNLIDTSKTMLSVLGNNFEYQQKGEPLFLEEPMVVGPSREKKMVSIQLKQTPSKSKSNVYNIRFVWSAWCQCRSWRGAQAALCLSAPPVLGDLGTSWSARFTGKQ